MSSGIHARPSASRIESNVGETEKVMEGIIVFGGFFYCLQPSAFSLNPYHFITATPI
jgi:hypothetical protein